MKAPCSLCSAQGRAECPALGDQICGPCCGTGRNNTITCSADCQFNPFGVNNYDAWLRVDASLTSRMSAYLRKYYSDLETSKFVSMMLPEGDRSYQTIVIATTAAVYYLYFSKVFKNGKTVAQLWQDEGWVGLNADEIAMMKYRVNSSPAMVEVHNILDSQSMECTDLLNPKRGVFVLYDRTLAKNLLRYSRLWVWLTDYPYYSRPACDSVDVPKEVYKVVLKEMLSFIAGKRAKKNATVPRSEALGRKFGEYWSLIRKEASNERQRKLSRVDFSGCRAYYEIKTSREDVKRVLDSKPDFCFYDRPGPDDPPWPALSYYWLCLGESKVIEKDMKSFFQYDDGQKMIPVVGSIYLGEKEVMIRTIAKVNFDFAKKMVDVYWGESLKYRREVVVELGKQMAERDAEGRCRIPGGDDDREMYENKAPLSEMDKMKLTDLYNKHYETFSDVAMNDLDGMTPMNAAKSVNMRSRLIEFMKWHINHVGFVNKKQELSIDISWLLEELGLHELL